MNNFTGLVLTVVAGTSVGFSMWPLKWARSWRWENFWLVFSLFSLIVFPIGLALSVVPHLAVAYASLSLQEVLRPLLLGLLWGFAQLGAGVCIQRLGLAVTVAVLSGVGAAFGTIIPLISLHREMVLATNGLLILIGTMLMLAGAIFCGWSGYLREVEARERDIGGGFGKEQVAMRQENLGASAYLLTLGIAVGSGVLSSLLNIALAYGTAIVKAAEACGAKASSAPFAVWPIALLGGSVANLAYSVYLLNKNQTWSHFGSFASREILYPLFAALLWMAGIAVYSSGTTFLGDLGVSVGFAVYMISMIFNSQFAAIISGEWHLMKARTYKLFALGVCLLVVAVLTIGTSNYLHK
jgi:L-rhamnose-H+ transport protein